MANEQAHDYAAAREIATAIRRAIDEGEYAPGDRLPSERVLATTYRAARNTARAAIQELAREGLVRSEHGRGSFVRERPSVKRLGVERYAKRKWKAGENVAFIADREASGLPWQRDDQTQTVALVTPPPQAAEVLGVDPEGEVYARERLVRLNDRPTHTLTSYYRVADVEGTALVDPTPGPAGPGGGFAVLAAQGLEPHEVTETIHARMPTPGEVATLELPAGEPVMILERIVRTRDGRAVEYATGVHAASLFAWTYAFDMPD